MSGWASRCSDPSLLKQSWHDVNAFNQRTRASDTLASRAPDHQRYLRPMLEICHLSNIAMRLGRPLDWDPDKREVIGDKQANSFLSRENRKGYEINM